MKRAFCFVLAVLLVFGMCACGKTGEETPAEPVRDPNMPLKLFAYDLAQIPIATAQMTKAELRQLCLDYMQMQVSFQWKTDMDLSFHQTNNDKGKLKNITTSNLYGGIFYQSVGFGNIYRWLEYYDETTGVMPMSVALAENGGYGEGAAVTDQEFDENGKLTYQKYRSLMTFGNQCSGAAGWAWGRVINSVKFAFTNGINVYNGYIPVGCYTYGYDYNGKHYGPLDIQVFGEGSGNPGGYDTDDVIRDWNAANGDDAMYKCYAQLKPGDCVVDEGHVMMVKSVNLFTSNDGTVDYTLSTVTVHEQVEGWGFKDNINGVKLYQQGRVDKAYTFAQLQKNGYLPFTFLEFLDENDPQDKKHLDYYNSYADQLKSVKNSYKVFPYADEMGGAGVEKAKTYCTHTGDRIKFAELTAMTVGSNYPISDVFVTVKDSSGKQLLRNVYRAERGHIREVSMQDGDSTWEIDCDGNRVPVSSGIEPLANGSNVIEITMQLSTGELLTAYKGTLTK